ncbi:phage antirepressor [Lactobacillus sp. PV037]|uniref:phage antirepressor n=1 Tax=Lactobacillus sp. PV037 TaxID=2594496 RepID=UPI0022404627|nr:phage antirepressor KilAC domain-containing protein [Lactobacillus sp. PV037]QNQ83808.1 phage antirepressor [Lactobacillus sp. PV037]
MEDQLAIFNFEDQQVRTVIVDEQLYFVGKDVATILGYKRSADAIKMHVDEEDKGVGKIQTPGGKQSLTIITESGLYSLILSSKLPTAKKFKHWVTSEVLPTIRKKGIYMTDEKAVDIVTNKDSLADLLSMASEQLREKDIKIGQLENQVDELMEQKSYLDVILSTTDPIAITQIAADYGYSARAFNTLLNEVRIQHKVNGQWILYRMHMGKNYTVSKTKTFKDKSGKDHTKMQTYWTQTGRKAIYRILKEKMDILPLLEREDIE